MIPLNSVKLRNPFCMMPNNLIRSSSFQHWHFLTSTLSKAVHKLFGFTFVFGIILYGFAQAHTIVFGQSVKQVRLGIRKSMRRPLKRLCSVPARSTALLAKAHTHSFRRSSESLILIVCNKHTRSWDRYFLSASCASQCWWCSTWSLPSWSIHMRR